MAVRLAISKRLFPFIVPFLEWRVQRWLEMREGMWKTVAESGWTDVAILGTAFIWALVLILTSHPVQRRLRLKFAPLVRLSTWFQAVPMFEIRYEQHALLSKNQVGVDAQVRDNVGAGVLEEVCLRLSGSRPICTTKVMSKAGEVYGLPMVISGSSHHRFVFDLPETLSGKTYKARLEAHRSKKVSKSSPFLLGLGAEIERERR